MKSIWEWLEIEPTKDVSVIRKAYSEQAKKYHPEENPEEFKLVREAYKKALSYAKSHSGEQNGKGFESAEAADSHSAENIRHAESVNDASNISLQYEKNAAAAEKEEAADTDKDKDKGTAYHYDLSAKTNADKTASDKKVSGDGKGKEQADFHYTYEKTEQVTLDDEQKKQLEELVGRMKIIYSDAGMRNNILAWKMLFSNKDCNYNVNFNNPEFMAVVINLLYEMQGLKYDIIDYIGKKISVNKHAGADWQYIRSRFEAIRQSSRNSDIKSAKNSKSPGRMYMAEKLFGDKSKTFKKYRWIYVAAIVVVVIFFFGRFGFRNAARSEDMRYDLKFMLDLNDDGVRDFVKYDNKKKELVLELFNAETGDYEMWGTLEDYCEKYPEAQNKLSDYYKKEQP